MLRGTPIEVQENSGPLYLRMRRTDSNAPTLHTPQYVFYTQRPAFNKQYYEMHEKARKCIVKNQQSIDENPGMEQMENDQSETLK